MDLDGAPLAKMPRHDLLHFLNVDRVRVRDVAQLASAELDHVLGFAPRHHEVGDVESAAVAIEAADTAHVVAIVSMAF